ncbi:isopeptide-forming domain-containing fimbrial protein [Erythrobacter sp. W53]|uniref:isopeptide-forming domain-containing fimbrial protein n=1 Tax=Erythrobacter sp. W53 TaxID=3425947 RepID=UPI003D767431
MLGAALLPFGVLGSDAKAQEITNVAEANWSFQGVDYNTQSNETITPVEPAIAVIETFRPSNGGTTLTFREPFCAANSSQQTQNSQNTPQGVEVSRSSQIVVGEDLFFEVSAEAANIDPNAIDNLVAELTTANGDREEITIFETANNSGVFAGRIGTRRAPPAPTQLDCWLSLNDEQPIHITVTPEGSQAIVVEADVDVLADPFGVVFDSETGEPVDGAVVTLIDVATGLPATVFAEDGVTSWPSTVISGSPITDGAGNVTVLGAGEYWFPLTFLGTYRIEITPPASFTAPSAVDPAEISQLTRPGGGNFVILDASYGGSFELDSPVPVQIDIPVDQPSADITLVKTASRARVQPGDAILYAITATNPNPDRLRRNVILTDTPSPFLRLRPDSVRIDGAEAPGAVTITPDGRQLTVSLGDLAGGASSRVTYVMTVREDASPGNAENRAQATDSLGRTSFASAVVDIERETIADRMTIIGRVVAGSCHKDDQRVGIPGVRVMMEDGSFAITDVDGRYHFEGVVPGTHVVQASRMTLPEGGEFIDCHRSTRNAGSASSQFVIGQGGMLKVVDFYAKVHPQAFEILKQLNEQNQLPELVSETNSEATRDAESRSGEDLSEASEEPAGTNWIALGDGEDGWLTPAIDENPRAPAIRVAIRHRKQYTVKLSIDGEPVNPLNYEGTRSAPDGSFSVSEWRGVPLNGESTLLTAEIVDSFGLLVKELSREVFFTNSPTKVELVPEQSKLIADGRTNPVIAVRVLDRNNRPLREGIAGQFMLSEPYQSASQLEQQQLNQLTGLGASQARWVVEGDEGIALIELAPTMVSGSLRLDFSFSDGEVTREQQLETWIEPGEIEWTVVGLAEGSIGARTVADNMERAGDFKSDLGDKARVALYVKGRVLGKYLVTLAYDSAKQRDDQRVLGALDPNAYYTVFGDGSSRRFDAASRENLYVRIETATFYALYGDFQTGFDQTRLTRYNRTATGVKAEARIGDNVQVQGFAAEIGTRFRRDELQGEGITGPYQLSSRLIVPNSEQVLIEVRDRFRSEQIVETRTLTRFIDYDIDLLSGTITFKQPVLSRDFNLNPQFIVVTYEIDELQGGELNAGLRATLTVAGGDLRIGATAVSDRGDDARTNLGGVDLQARIGENTEIRAEVALSRNEGETTAGWLVEAQHQSGMLDVLAYAHALENGYGVGQQNGAEQGRRKIGADARVRLNEKFSVLGSVWQDDALDDISRRRAAQLQVNYEGEQTDVRVGIAHFADRLTDGTRNKSTVLEGGVTQRLLDNKLELNATTSVPLGATESIDLPLRHRIGARYAVTNNVRLVGLYEIADGENIDARTISGGIEVTPWTGSQVVTSLGKQRIDESGERTYAAFGLAQSLQVNSNLTIDATIDGSRTLGGTPAASDIVNPLQPVSSGGQLGPNATQFEDFTAVTLGAAWRKDRWSATARGEYRDGEFADRKGVTAGAIRQLGEGKIVGSGFTWTRAEAENGSTSEIMDASLALAFRPDESEFAFLSKLEYRSDEVTNAIAGAPSAAGRTALIVNGDAKSRRVIGSVSANWSPRGEDDDGNITRRDEFGLFAAVRHNFDRFEGFDLGSTSALLGADARIGIGERFEVGATATVRTNLDDNVTSFSVGPQIGFVPADGMLLTVGYNVTGFRDPDFSAARNTDKGLYASVRLKFDADTFSFLRRD